MKTRTFTFTAVAALAALLIFSGSGLAARKTCDDGSFPPCADTGSGMEPPDYGDLIILYRDINGVPIPLRFGYGGGSRDRLTGRRRTVLATHRF